MTVYQRPIPKWKLAWYRIRYRTRSHPYEYACDVIGCMCCYEYLPEPTGKWTVYEP